MFPGTFIHSKAEKIQHTPKPVSDHFKCDYCLITFVLLFVCQKKVHNLLLGRKNQTKIFNQICERINQYLTFIATKNRSNVICSWC